MSLQVPIPQSLQDLANRFAADHEARLQQLADCMPSTTTPELPHLGTINLDELIPDISLNLSHLRALLSSAYNQIQSKNPTLQQFNAACWLISDAMKEVSAIEDIYYAEPDTPAPEA